MTIEGPGVRIRVIDAFTGEPFTGNPAGVCLLEAGGWPDESWMRRVAAEMRHSETAFAYPLPDGDGADWALRWFTPAAEVDLCGHATLATAHALHADSGRAGTIRFSSRSGILLAHTHGGGSITLDFPAARLATVPVASALTEALGASPEAAFGTGDLGDVLVVVRDEATVRALEPDLAALAQWTRAENVRGVIVTAPAAEPGTGYDYVSRFFAPAVDVDEDPFTGSAHTALAPYWSRRLDSTELVGLQASARGGTARTAIAGERVHLTGGAVTVLDGTVLAAGG
ncbi:PhzF family phenazine biosynthesis protein [Haloechinothrix sp. YIM 98757]|uniref:PhzF family phenazine biosynthesis protein n=1 Tax=Haloechinothrix aidingensis TaxID=2752311 RepID=A0A838A7G9_9PSEU|nr:PhzF family phenazine biosynthesis protein [Haloechinothrix aidingensis]MBA0124477.1 PhzF family phenazine biosynthesis protein [Haloechinothrix aidingensis]